MWKFNLAAWIYLQKKHETIMDLIAFESVYAIYGTIDIKDSTLKRNQTLLHDIHNLLDNSIIILNILIIEQYYAVEDIIKCCKILKFDYRQAATVRDEAHIVKFLNAELKPLLSPLVEKDPKYSSVVKTYLKLIDPASITRYEYRDRLEKEIGQLNEQITGFTAIMIEELHQPHPSYTKIFRTDRVEHGIYLDKSITPQQNFDHSNKLAYSALQLRYVAQIIKSIMQKSKNLPLVLTTIQFIFTSFSPINIPFLNDERWFDVEGLNNISYEIIKKRIDKIFTKDSTERFNQLRKTAIIYDHSDNNAENLYHIGQLQKEGILQELVGYLWLEDLKDVFGLMAIRVAV